MNKDRLYATILLSVAIIGIILSFFSLGKYQPNSNNSNEGNSVVKSLSSTGDKILSLELSGVIMDGQIQSILGGETSQSVKVRDQLLKAAKDNSIKGVLIRVNSPGGAVGISQEIYQAARKVREKKPVITSMGDVAASGGYYVASASDLIFANSGTLTGSIGVISHFTNFEGIMGKVGVKDMTIKSGRYKDIGSSSRAMTGEEQEILQALVDDTYEQFIKDVYEGRRTKDGSYGDFRKKLTRDDIKYLAEGMIYTGKQAKEVGLVDRLGTYNDALDELQRMVKKRSKGKIKQNLSVIESIGVSKSLKDIFGLSSTAETGISVESLMQLLLSNIKGGNLSLPQSKMDNKSMNFAPPVMLIAPEFMNSY